MNSRPKKSLGQNFLTSVPARIAIVNAGKLTPLDTVLEIGPGKGFLTQGLLETGAHVIALEKDRELIPLLKEQFSSYKNFTLVEGDALEFDILNHKPVTSNYKLVANIPYYITGAILSKYLSNNNQPTHMVVLVQQEVAERVVAKDGKESILSIAVKVYGDPKIVYRVKRGSFNPTPNVDSAVLSIENISKNNLSTSQHEKRFFEILKVGFSHKRKFLLSNLKEKFPGTSWYEAFKKNAIDEKSRAETLTLANWINLAKEN